MNFVKVISVIICVAMFSGCSTVCPSGGARGPSLVSSGYATESGQYAEIGVQFTTSGDFLALFAPSRWRSPIRTGGTLSWLNPVAWSDDAKQTGRILAGQAILVGGAAAAFSGGSDGGSSSGGGSTGGVEPPPPDGGPGPPPGP